MTHKEELKTQYTDLTKEYDRLLNVDSGKITGDILDKIEAIHKKRMEVINEIIQINEQEQ